jgi:hypothetical protein
MSAANARTEQSSLIHDGGRCYTRTSSPRYGRRWTPTWDAAAPCPTPLWPDCPTSVRCEGDAPRATHRERHGGRRPLVPAGTMAMVTLRSSRSLRLASFHWIRPAMTSTSRRAQTQLSKYPL